MADDMEPRPGETIVEYIARRHASERGGRRGRGCTCPTAYSRCRYAVVFDEFHGDRSMGHGGWGWHGGR